MGMASVYAKGYKLDILCSVVSEPDGVRRPFYDLGFLGFDKMPCPAWGSRHEGVPVFRLYVYLHVSPMRIQSPLRRPPYTLGSRGLPPRRPSPMLSRVMYAGSTVPTHQNCLTAGRRAVD